MRTLSVGTLLRWTRKQVDEFGLNAGRIAARDRHQCPERTSRSVEELSRRRDCVKRLDNLQPRRIDVRRWDLPLPGKNLPQADGGLKRPYGISAQSLAGNGVHSIRQSQKASNGCIVQLRKLGKDRIPGTEIIDTVRQGLDGGR